MRKLFLHVGVHRTGTTSTQRVLSDNFQPLLQRGYLYPYGTPRHDALVRKLWFGRMTAEEWAEDLEQRAKSHPVPVEGIILSDEDMSMIRDFRIFAPLAQRFEVKVVLLLRRQDLWLESWYLQNVKWQWDMRWANLSFPDFLARRAEFHWMDYGARLAHYEAVFGPGSVLPGVFERSEMPDGPTAAILRLMGIDPGFIGPEVHQNPSLSPLMSEFVRQLPLGSMKEGDRRWFELAAFAVDAGLGQTGSKLIMDATQRAELMAGHAAGNRAVAERWFGREALFREPLPGPDTPLAETALPASPEEMMSRFVAPMMAALGTHFADQRERMEQIQRGLEEARRALTQATQVKRLPERV